MLKNYAGHKAKHFTFIYETMKQDHVWSLEIFWHELNRLLRMTDILHLASLLRHCPQAVSDGVFRLYRLSDWPVGLWTGRMWTVCMRVVLRKVSASNLNSGRHLNLFPLKCNHATIPGCASSTEARDCPSSSRKGPFWNILITRKQQETDSSSGSILRGFVHYWVIKLERERVWLEFTSALLLEPSSIGEAREQVKRSCRRLWDGDSEAVSITASQNVWLASDKLFTKQIRGRTQFISLWPSRGTEW